MRSMAAERDGARRRMAAAAALAALVLGLGLVGCEDSDPVAPADSTITVSANPQTVVVTGGVGTSEIIARVHSKNGTLLPGQQVTFSTNTGTLDPNAETLLLTDDEGAARSTLFTGSPATVTARSGSIMGTTQVNTVPGDLAQFVLRITPVQELVDCDDTLTFTAEVRTTTGTPAGNVQVCFLQDPLNTIVGNFNNPGEQGFTDPDTGTFSAEWNPGSLCDDRCSVAQDPNGGGICTFFFTVDDCSGNFESRQVQVQDLIQ